MTPVVMDAGPAEATATFSACRTYRYLLTRVVGDSSLVCLFVMLNPSTADAFKLDPTVRRCVGFARSWQCGTLMVANAHALRSTDPKALYITPGTVEERDAPGRNDEIIAAAVRSAAIVVCAWGKHGRLAGRGDRVAELVRRELRPDARLWHLGINGDGTPKHPLYRPNDVVPEDWR